MAFKGHKRQGYALLTIVENADGTTTETVAVGKATRHTISFSGSSNTSTTSLYAGDQKEYEDTTAEGTVSIGLSQLPLEDEAELCGHEYSPSEGMVVKDSDAAPYVRYAAIGTGTRKNDVSGLNETFYRLTAYYKVKFGRVDDEYRTKEASTSWITPTLSGTSEYNADHKMKFEKDFTTFEAALAAFNVFLNIGQETPAPSVPDTSETQ